MRFLTALLLFALFFTASNSTAAEIKSSLTCKNQAINESKRLLGYFRDNDSRIVIDDKVSPLNKKKNPQDKNQRFDVIETWGYIYKGKYRMRFIFLPDCTLLGEEILEYVNP